MKLGTLKYKGRLTWEKIKESGVIIRFHTMPRSTSRECILADPEQTTTPQWEKDLVEAYAAAHPNRVLSIIPNDNPGGRWVIFVGLANHSCGFVLTKEDIVLPKGQHHIVY